MVAADDEANMPVKEVTVTASGKIRISPRAKRLATDNNVDYSSFHGSGPNGRIITADIEKFLESSSSGKPGELAADEYRDTAFEQYQENNCQSNVRFPSKFSTGHTSYEC